MWELFDADGEVSAVVDDDGSVIDGPHAEVTADIVSGYLETGFTVEQAVQRAAGSYGSIRRRA